MTDQEILTACDTYGAKTVYDAAYRRIAGDRNALLKVGLPDVETIAEADRIGSVAYRTMSASSQAADLADVTINLARISSRNE